MIRFPGPAGGRACIAGLPFDQSNVSGTWALRRLFSCELNPLPFAQQFEDASPDGAAVEEMFDAALVTNKPESLVDEETCNSPGRHSRVPPMRESLRQSQALPGPLDERTYEAMKEPRPRRAPA